MVVIQKNTRRSVVVHSNDVGRAAVRRRFIVIVIVCVIFFFHMHLYSTKTAVTGETSTIRSSEIVSGPEDNEGHSEYLEFDDLDFMDETDYDDVVVAIDDMLMDVDDDFVVDVMEEEDDVIVKTQKSANKTKSKGGTTPSDDTAKKKTENTKTKATGSSTGSTNDKNDKKKATGSTNNKDFDKTQAKKKPRGRNSFLPDHSKEELIDGPVRVEKDDSIYKHKKCWDCSPVVVESQRLVFFTVPKVGCTVFKQLFRRMMNYTDWTTHQEGGQQIPHNPRVNGLQYLHHFSTGKATEMMTSPNWTRAIFLREPKERALSAYLDKVGNNHGKYVRFHCAEHCMVNESLICSAAAKRSFPKDGGMILTFTQFLENVLEVCEDIHWNAQWERMEAKYWKTINFVGYFDTIEQDTKRLLHNLADPQAWEKYGAAGWKRQGATTTSSIFSSDTNAKHATNAADRLARYYTPKLKNRVESFYRGDYESKFFQFTPPTNL